tara:strand:- start:2338 stop:4086 length:1749 start_codon:yes stop_codon:yes gene_type:complete
MMLTKSPDGAFGTNSGQAMALDEDILICQAISDPLDGAQTVGGVGVTVEGFVEGESVNWDSMFPYISIRVVSEDGTVVRGTLFVGPGHAGNPWPTGGASEARQIMDAGLAVASVAASDRDRIVVEFGADPDVGAGVGPPYDIELTFGRPDVADITVEGDVGKVPWIEFSQTLKFVSPSTYDGVLLYPSDSELILGASLPRTPVTYKGVLLDPSGLLTGVWTAGPAPQTFAGILLDPSGLLVSPAPSTAYTHAVSDTIGLLDAVAVAEGQFRTSLASDTLRGGAVIIFSSTRNLSDKSLDQTLLSTTLPAGWTPTAVGAGTVVTPQAKGLLIQTGNAAASSGLAVIPATYGDYFDMRVTASAETLAGSILSASSVNRAAALIVYTASYVILSTIQYIRGGFYAVSQAGPTSADPFISTSTLLGTTTAEVKDIELRITCGQDQVWISVGSTPALAVALPGFTAEAKTAQLQTSNDGVSGGILGTRYTDFKVRSVGLIAGRFIDNSTYDQPGTIVGNVPAAKTRGSFDMDDLGLVDLEVFGPWGRTLIADGFEYTKPIPKIWSGGIGESPATLDLITDPMIRSDS